MVKTSTSSVLYCTKFLRNICFCFHQEKRRRFLDDSRSIHISVFFPARTCSCHCHGWTRLLLLTGALYLQIWQHSKNTYTTFIQTYNHTHTPSNSQDQPITFHIKGHHVSPSSKFSELRLPHCSQDKVQRPQHCPRLQLLSLLPALGLIPS